MADEETVDLREDQEWLRVPKKLFEGLDEETLGFPRDLEIKEANKWALRLGESFLAKTLLGQGRGLGMLYGYRQAIECQTRDRAFREGIAFALNVMRRFASK